MKSIEFNGTVYGVLGLNSSEQRRNTRVDKYNVANNDVAFVATVVTQFKDRLDNVGVEKVTKVVEAKPERVVRKRQSLNGEAFAEQLAKVRKAVTK